MATQDNDFTNGPILSKMLRFMVPILGALILQAMYGAVDILIVGKFGTTAGISGPEDISWIRSTRTRR
mgnify:CR=1 FL=1